MLAQILSMLYKVRVCVLNDFSRQNWEGVTGPPRAFRAQGQNYKLRLPASEGSREVFRSHPFTLA